MIALAEQKVRSAPAGRFVLAQRKGLIITDFGGTLAFADDALRKASKELVQREMSKEDIRKLERNVRGNIYDCALRKYWEDYRPNSQMIEIVSGAYAKNKEVMIMSANMDDVEPFIRSFLKKNDIPFDLLLLRRLEEETKTDESWKAEVIIELVQNRPAIDIYEDKIDNLTFIMNKVGFETEDGEISYHHVTPANIYLIT